MSIVAVLAPTLPMNIVFDLGAVIFSWQPQEIVRGMFPERAPTAEAARQLAADIFHHGDWHDFDRGAIELAQIGSAFERVF